MITPAQHHDMARDKGTIFEAAQVDVGGIEMLDIHLRMPMADIPRTKLSGRRAMTVGARAVNSARTRGMSDADPVVGGAESDDFATISEALLKLLSDEPEKLADIRDKALQNFAKSLHDSLVGHIVHRGEIHPDVRMHLHLLKANKRILDATPMLTQIQAAEALGKPANQAPTVMGRAYEAGKVLRITTPEGIRYPLFQFKPSHFELQPVIAALLAEVSTSPRPFDEMDLLRFLMNPHAELVDNRDDDVPLDESRPAWLIGRDDAALVTMLRDHLAGPDGQ